MTKKEVYYKKEKTLYIMYGSIYKFNPDTADYYEVEYDAADIFSRITKYMQTYPRIISIRTIISRVLN